MEFGKIFTPAAIAANITEAAGSSVPYLGAALFPAAKKAGLDLSYIKGKRGLPVSLAPSAFDAKAKLRDRIGVTKIEAEMPFFREAFLIKEKDRQEILRAADSKDPYALAVISAVFDDARSLVDGANVVPERMIWQLLAPTDGSPKIAISANGANYAYNFDADEEFKTNNFTALSGTSAWSDATNCDPIADLRAMQDKIEDASGTRPTRAVMNRKTFNYMLASSKVKSAVLSQNVTANVFMTDAVVKTLVLQLLGLSISVYTKKFANESKVATSFVPDNVVSMLPDGTIGRTWYGTTPEEADAGSGAYSTALVNTGVSITTIAIAHPVNIETIASEIVLPSFERIDEIGVIKVA